jgi:hypothetical protein
MHITNSKELQAMILELEKKEAMQKDELISQFYNVAESLKPVNIIKNAFNNLTDSIEVSDTAIGLIIGGLVEKLILGKSPGLLRKTIASLLSVPITNIAIKNAAYIKTTCSHLLERAVSFFKDISKQH